MRVDQRPEHTAEAGIDGGAHAALGLELFFDALEDQHVRVDADPHREHEPRNARQRHHGADVRHEAEQDHEIEEQRDDGVDARQPVVEQHEQDHEPEADERRGDARTDRVGAEAWTNRSLGEVGQ